MKLTIGDRPMGVEVNKTPKKEKKVEVALTGEVQSVAMMVPPFRAFELLNELEQVLEGKYTERPTMELYDAKVHVAQLRQCLLKAKL